MKRGHLRAETDGLVRRAHLRDGVLTRALAPALLLAAFLLGGCAAWGASCGGTDRAVPCIVDGDGDGLGDDRDRCPEAPAATPDGCPAPG